MIAQVPEVRNYDPRDDQPPVFNEDIGGNKSKDATGGFSLRNSLTQSPLAQQASVSSPLRGFCHPLNGEGWLSQGIRGKTHQGRMEFAYDLATSLGTPVYAMRTGRVIAVRDKYPDVGGGKENIARFNYVWIEHDGGYRSMYAHLQQGFRGKVAIKAGDLVKAGQLIGYSGNSGWSTGPHLHVEVQQPSRRRTFTQTVPFAIAGTCQNGQLASNSN
ncbi:MAG: M23 family metallopeptidase [Acaryochloridaceae cyanobacterium CSU_3_4]|nr:M23 family metallopeptidase [Acaryochloridaceae cyanobacterium CSU_3_4]